MNTVLYIHGKDGSAEESEHFKPLFPDCKVIGLDYQTFTPWETGQEIHKVVEKLKNKYENVILIANSIGAFFSMNADIDGMILKAYFISPVVDMEKLSGIELTGEWLRYVKSHPIHWNVPTHILYGNHDHLVPFDTVNTFAKMHNATLTVMEGGEHWFHTEEQMRFLVGWIKENSMAPKRVIGIGETVLDILFKNDQPLKAVPGGSTFNSIVSLGRAGVPCAMLTDVGGDHVGDMICHFLVDNGVSAEYVCRHGKAKSHITLAFLDENNDAQYLFYKDHASVLLDGKLPRIGKDDVVLFGSFFAINPAIRPVVGSLLHSAHEAGAWLYYDVNFRKNHIVDLPEVMPNIKENMSLANVVRGSMEDFDYMLGLHDGGAIYKRLSRHCQTLILTDGPRSIRVYTPEGCETYPVQTIETVSTVGAGDNFNAGYIYAMLQGMDNQASRIAMAQRWSQDVCGQIGNNISDELVTAIKQQTSRE